MAITTLTSYKAIKGITTVDAARDARIEALIIQIETDYLRIRNRPFEIGDILTITDPCTTDGDITVTLDGNDTEIEVEAGDNEIAVAQKIYFALLGLYFYCVTVAGESVTFKSGYTVFALAFDGGTTGVTATTTGLDTIYPQGAEMTAIDMIAYQVASRPVGVASEGLGDHSVSYGPMTGQYPQEITGAIRRYVSFV